MKKKKNPNRAHEKYVHTHNTFKGYETFGTYELFMVREKVEEVLLLIRNI